MLSLKFMLKSWQFCFKFDANFAENHVLNDGPPFLQRSLLHLFSLSVRKRVWKYFRSLLLSVVSVELFFQYNDMERIMGRIFSKLPEQTAN